MEINEKSMPLITRKYGKDIGTLVTLEKSTVLYGCGTRETLKDEWTSGRIVDWFTQFP